MFSGIRRCRAPGWTSSSGCTSGLVDAVAAGIPVIVDATHARRAWRLAITQAMALPAPVEWIGWWLFTDLPNSLEWNARRTRPVPVIQEMAAALADPHFGPMRAKDFAALCSVVPTHHDDLTPVLQAELAALDRRIRSATNRGRQVQRHGYSHLLDLERLLHHSGGIYFGIDLRSWLFAFGGGIRIESPEAMRQELLQRCRETIEANGTQESEPAGFSFCRRARPD